MQLNSPFFVSTVCFGVSYLLSGLILNYFPPKERNSYYGYRTARAMQTQEKWQKAQKLAGSKLAQLGVFLCGVAFLPNTLNDINGTLISLFVSVSLTIFTIINIEKQLKG